MEKKFYLHYYVSDGGDGSASIDITETAEQAEKLDKEQNEDGGWAEPSNGAIEIKVEDGIPYVEISGWDDDTNKYFSKWVPLQESK